MALTYRSFGAAQEVTGSKHLITIDGARVLLDCGVFQGKRLESYQKNLKLPFDPKTLDDVILSHGHYDHCGNLPTLSKLGYTGNITTTPASRDIANLVMLDAAHLQQKDAEFLAKRHPGQQVYNPLYTVDDVIAAVAQFVTINYRRPFRIAGGATAEFYEAGHILGSAMTLLRIPRPGGNEVRVLYTGDIGRTGTPIIRDPDPFPQADYVICESTYGNRLHDPIDDAMSQLAAVVQQTYARGGKIIIPAFAVERTQELIYFLHVLTDRGTIPALDIFVDSPMAVNATSIFQVHPECYNRKIHQQFLDHHENPFGFSQVRYVSTKEESQRLNERTAPCIIISASGMCEGGRILHHLQAHIGDPRNTVLIVGYMGQNTLGRKLADRAEEVTIYGQRYPRKCQIKILNTFSAHADYKDICTYFKPLLARPPKTIFLVHGELEAATHLRGLLLGMGFPDVQVSEQKDYELV